MGGKAVPQRVNTDTLGDAGALGCHSDIVDAVRRVVPGKAVHQSLVARDHAGRAAVLQMRRHPEDVVDRDARLDDRAAAVVD